MIEKSVQKELKVHYQSGNKSTIKRIEQIILELANHPETGIGQPEKLKFDLSGYCYRRINQKERLIYRIEQLTIVVTIISTMGHYNNR
nr:Txe/YoeB family addiction module toxin [Pseudopedobacter sp.]